MREGWRALACVLVAAGCGNVGTTRPDSRSIDVVPPRCSPTAAFGTLTPLTALNTSTNDENARLSPDELTLYFDSTRAGGPGGFDVYVSTRAATSDPFGAPELLAGVNTTRNERDVTVTGDGLTLYADTFNGTDYDLSMATRTDTQSAFSALSLVPSVNGASGVNDANPFVLPDGSAIYFGSDRGGNYDIYRAARNGSSFDAPVAVTGTNLAITSQEIVAALTPDELTMLFASDRPGGLGNLDIYVTTRASRSVGFDTPVALTALNSTDIDIPNWISADGCVLYFTRHSSITGYDLYVTTRGM
jgi:hypothetical protein